MEDNLKKAVLEALSTVEDPDLKKDLVSLKMIQALQVTAEQVSFTLVLTTPACPLQEYFKQACIETIHTYVNQEISIQITTSAQVIAGKPEAGILPHIKNVIAIASGKGGIGKSTIAANLAVGLAAQGATVGLLDADIFGPSIPTLFACEQEKPAVEQIENKKYIVPLVKYGVKLVSIGFLAPQQGAVSLARAYG